MNKETTATTLTVEQEQAQAQAEKEAKQAAREARLDQMVKALQDLFPENLIEKKHSSVRLVSSTDTFYSSDMAKVAAIATLYGNSGYYITASIAAGMRVIMY
mgnify:CR=1 FL=1